MYETYSARGLQILASPCNQFGAQEPWPEQQVKDWVTSTYNIEFPLLSKIDVKGDNTSKLYKHMTAIRPEDEIKWNFFKYLLDGEGNFVKFASHREHPDELIPDIERLLSQWSINFLVRKKKNLLRLRF